MQKYKEINGNDYVKNSRTTINETMQSIQSMNSGTAFPTNNLFEGMKCYRTDLKKTYTLTDVENNTWVEDAHATLSDEATHAASATKLQTARSLNLGGAVTADAATFDGTANATINVKTLDATKLKGTASVSTTGNAATATKVVTTAAAGTSANIAEATMASSDSARIRVSGAENAGELALETADDGNEAIVARQYTGTYTTPVRTAKILDESGNTSFPGTVVAPNFTGSLNGNAATAGKLSTARKINITGNASGSATFDGSGDVSISTTVNESKHAAAADTLKSSPATETDTTARPVWLSWAGDNTKQTVSPNLTYTCSTKTLTAANFAGHLAGNADTATNASHAKNADKATTANTATTATNASHAGTADSATNSANANRLSSESGNNYLSIDTTTNSWSVIGSNPGNWLKSIRTKANAPAYSIGNYSAAIAFGGGDTKGIITHAYDGPGVKFAGGNGSTAGWKFSIYGGYNNEKYDLNNFPTKTGGGASGTWPINISGNAATATTATKANTATTAAGLSGDLVFPDIGNTNTSRKITWNGSTDGADIYYQTAASDQGNLVLNLRDDANCYLRIAANGAFKSYFSPSDGNFHGNVNGTADSASSVPWAGVTGKPGTYPPSAHNHDSAYPSVTGTRASGTWGINISGNAASATNADKLDGYHASDIINRITAANTGGIVAASLTENGYVKFANGLILQWGSKKGNAKRGEDKWYNCAFPIAFSAVPTVIDGHSSNNINNITNTGFDMVITWNYTGRYIAIGI